MPDKRNRSIFHPISLALICSILLMLSSCEKVVDIDLNEVQKKYVIEGVVTDVSGISKVLISQTKNFDEDNSFAGVSGARVTMKEDGGTTAVFTETTPGTYEEPIYRGRPGKTYTLTVRIGNQTFTAKSTMPQRVELDSIFVTDEFLFSDTRKIVNAMYKDPAGRGNSYRFIQYVNDHKVEQIFIQNDEYTDGRNVVSKLFYFTDDDDDESNVKSGDELRIDMLCIDPTVYKYWFSLFRSATGNSGQATPANPVSNIEGGALGYFSAHTQQTRTMVVP
jgi:Domain of unknown function (DUF4249)